MHCSNYENINNVSVEAIVTLSAYYLMDRLRFYFLTRERQIQTHFKIADVKFFVDSSVKYKNEMLVICDAESVECFFS